MIKNKKAQIMSLDILFTTILIILMFFLLFNVVESRLYQSSVDETNSELDTIGFLAYEKIINNPSLNCFAYDSDNNFTIPACLSATGSVITKKELGIPSNYKCNLTGVSFSINECDDIFISGNTYSYFVLDFKVIISPSLNFSKKDYIDNYTNKINILGTEQTLTLRVWK